MYAFDTYDKQTYHTAFSPREVARMYCFDAWDGAGNRYVVLTENTDFKTFEYQQ